MAFGTLSIDKIVNSDGFTLGGSGATMKNRIINGDMRIDQRNAGAAITGLTGGSNYAVDRWQTTNTTDGQVTIQQSATVPTGFANSHYLTVTTADSSLSSTQLCIIRHKIEGFNVADLGWGTASAKTVTLSFQVRSSVTGTFGGVLRNSADDRSYPFTYSISSANTFETKSVTIAGDTSGTWLTNNGIGIQVIFSLGSGSSRVGTAGAWAAAEYTGASGETNLMATNGATFYLTGVQLEVGSQATSFDYRQYGTELALCQRYYEKTYSLSVAPGTNSQPGLVDWSTASNGSGFCVINNRFNTAKRASPTLKGYTEGGTADNWYVSRSGSSGNQTVYLDIASEFGFRIYTSTGANWTVCRIEGHWTADAEL